MKQLRKSAEMLSKAITQFTILRLGVFFILTISFGHAFEKVGASKPQIAAQMPGCFIEFFHVPHNVHVTHVVAMPWINRAAICENGVSHG